ncbi:hypothetical protein K435DRAFT_854570 [Dendrothele bispora CBS 962.96]|uniref:Uncharacterized protein n=1 Tax=Dendrothele bispora (strain CBS 962.96) TaxID=1314807 RepID=A0A4S8MEW0_DENBC|nr:hypothetical protein K435DRAFT_854570 [Dendrothele bispora CBS 962.96]
MDNSTPPISRPYDLDALHNSDGLEYPADEQVALRAFLNVPLLLQLWKDAGFTNDCNPRRQGILDIAVAKGIKSIEEGSLPSSIPKEKSHLGPRFLELLYELTESPVASPSPSPSPPPVASSSTQPLPTQRKVDAPPAKKPMAPDTKKQWNNRRVAKALHADRYSFYHIQHQDKPWNEIHNFAIADLVAELGPEKMEEYARLAEKWRNEGPPEEHRDDEMYGGILLDVTLANWSIRRAALKKADALLEKFLKSMKQRFGFNVYALVNWNQTSREHVQDIVVKTTPGWLVAAELDEHHRRLLDVAHELFDYGAQLEASGSHGAGAVPPSSSIDLSEPPKKHHPAWTQVRCGPGNSYPLLFKLSANPSKSDMNELFKNFMSAVATSQGGLCTRRKRVPWNALMKEPHGSVIDGASVPNHLRGKVGPLDQMKLEWLIQWWEHLLDRQRRNEVPVTFQPAYLSTPPTDVQHRSSATPSIVTPHTAHASDRAPSPSNSAHASEGAPSPSPSPSTLPPDLSALGLESDNGSSPSHPVPEFLHALELNIARLPEAVPVAALSDTFAQFVHPESCCPHDTPRDELWEVGVNQLMHRAFWGLMSAEDMVPHVRRGPLGVQAYLGFVHYFVVQRGVSPGLFQERTELLNQAIELTCKRHLSIANIDRFPPGPPAPSSLPAATMDDELRALLRATPSSLPAATMDDDLRALQAAFPDAEHNANMEGVQFDSSRTFLGTKRKPGPPHRTGENKVPRLTYQAPEAGDMAGYSPAALVGATVPDPLPPAPSPSQMSLVPTDGQEIARGAVPAPSSAGRGGRGGRGRNRGGKRTAKVPATQPEKRQTRSKATPSAPPNTNQPVRRSVCARWDLTGNVQHVLLECGGDEELAKLVYPPVQDCFRRVFENIYRFINNVDRPIVDISLAHIPELPSILSQWVKSMNEVWDGVASQPMQVTDDLLRSDETLLSLQNFVVSILLRKFEGVSAEEILQIRWFRPNGQGLEHLLWAVFFWGRALSLSEAVPSKRYRWEEYQTIIRNLETVTDTLRKACKSRPKARLLLQTALPRSLHLVPSSSASG